MLWMAWEVVVGGLPDLNVWLLPLKTFKCGRNASWTRARKVAALERD